MMSDNDKSTEHGALRFETTISPVTKHTILRLQSAGEWSQRLILTKLLTKLAATMEALAELERVQTQLLRRISELEHRYLPQCQSHSTPSPSPSTDSPPGEDADAVARLSSILRANAVDDFSFKRVPPDYYDWPLEARRDALGAHSIDHLCKSIVLVNTQAPSNVVDCSDRKNSKYYVVVVQYTARFNAEAVKNFLYSLNNGTIAKKKFNYSGPK